MINRRVARVFAGVLTGLHAIVLAAVVVFLLYYFSNDGSMLRDAANRLGYSNIQVMFATIVGLISYVMVVGTLSTFVAVNQNLEDIKKLLRGGKS
jgi:ABC-type spermidine/putrescine transport system permease subunit II